MSECIEVIKPKLKPVPKFNVGHFPLGTIVTVEDNFLKFTPEDEREYEGQMYGLIRGAKVINVISNGPDSWLIEVDVPHTSPLIGGNLTCNIHWVRAIEQRGRDSCAPKAKPDSNGWLTNCVLREDASGIHRYDLDAIATIIYSAGGRARLSKKKLRKLITRVMPHHRVPIKDMVRQERAFWDSMYSEDDLLDW